MGPSPEAGGMKPVRLVGPQKVDQRYCGGCGCRASSPRERIFQGPGLPGRKSITRDGPPEAGPAQAAGEENSEFR